MRKKEKNGHLPQLKIKEITFNNKKLISFSTNCFVILVGPNNSGKSTMIKEIYNYYNTNIPKVLVKDIIFSTNDYFKKEKSLLNFIYSICYKNPDFFGNYFFKNNQFDDKTIINFVKKATTNINDCFMKGLGFFYEMFLSYIGTEERLISLKSTMCNNNYFDKNKNPIYNFLNGDKNNYRKLVCSKFSDAFSNSYIFPTEHNCQLKILYQQKPFKIQKSCASLVDYQNYISKIDSNGLKNTIDNQGDGYKSYLSILFSICENKDSIVLIDEPETFLYESQKRKMADLLLSSTENKQCFITTHDAILINEILKLRGRRDVKIIKIDRDDNVNSFTELSPYDLKNNNQAILSYRDDIIGSLFWKNIVIVEGQSDLTIYNEVYKRINEKRKTPIDINFVYANGCTQIATLCNFFKKINCKYCCIVDLDVLGEKNGSLKTICSSFDLDYNNLKQNIKELNSDIFSHQKRTNKTKKAEFCHWVDENQSKLTKASITNKINECFKDSVTDFLQKGTTKIVSENSNINSKVLSLVQDLSGYGIFVLKEGDLEHSLCSSIVHGKHGYNIDSYINDHPNFDKKYYLNIYSLIYSVINFFK